MDATTRKQIVSIIDDMTDMTVATVRPDNYPQATTVGYVNDGLTIYFGTTSDAQKTQNIARNNKVSLTIDRRYDTWDEIESLSLAGLATQVVDPEEQEKVGAMMYAKFPQIQGIESDELGTLVLFRIDPVVISLLDYNKGFGHTELVRL